MSFQITNHQSKFGHAHVLFPFPLVNTLDMMAKDKKNSLKME